MRLRDLRLEDAEFFASWGADERFRIAAGWSAAPRSARVAHFVALVGSDHEGSVRQAVVSSERVVGRVDVARTGAGEFEIGFLIGPSDEWRKGYASAAVQQALDYAQLTLKARRLIAIVHEQNDASRLVLERNGFTRTDDAGQVTFMTMTGTMLRFEHDLETEPARG